MGNNLNNAILGYDNPIGLTNNYGSALVANNYGSALVANNYTGGLGRTSSVCDSVMQFNTGEIIIKNMKVKQVNVVIFKVKRNEKNEVASSEFIQDLWVELKPGADLMLTVAKTLDPKYKPEEIIVKEIRSFEF